MSKISKIELYESKFWGVCASVLNDSDELIVNKTLSSEELDALLDAVNSDNFRIHIKRTEMTLLIVAERVQPPVESQDVVNLMREINSWRSVVEESEKNRLAGESSEMS